jgi:hypothetical protein
MRRLLAFLGLSLALAPAAQAGGSPERMIVVGRGGSWTSVSLRTDPNGALYAGGPAVAQPRAGFVRFYPLFGELPGAPGRFYPSASALCWDAPNRLGRTGPCYRLSRRTIALFRPASGVRTLQDMATVVRLSVCGVDLRLPNLAVGIELALHRGLSRTSTFPARSFQLEAIWEGPSAARRPRIVFVTPRGIWARGRLYAAPAGVWHLARLNLPR